MIPNQTFINFPEFANAGTRIAPDDAKYAAGMLPADVLPAQWTNYFFHGATKGVTDLNTGVNAIEKEINNVLDNRGIEPSASNFSQLLSALQSFKAEAILAAHPIGSIYWTSSTEDPAVTFGGGTWTRIKDRFVLAAGDTYANGATGGAATVTLTSDQMPSHTHTFTGSAVTSGANNRGHTHSVTAAGTVSEHSHTISHTHSVTAGGTISGGAYTFTGTEHSHTYTPAGSISVKTNPTFTGSSVATDSKLGKMVVQVGDRGNDDWNYVGNGYNKLTGYMTATHIDNIRTETSMPSAPTSWAPSTSGDLTGWKYDASHTHSVTAKGSISGGAYTFTGTQATLKATAGGLITVKTNPTFTGSAVTSGAASATDSGKATPTFTGSAVTSGAESQNHTHSVTAVGTNSNTGGGKAHNNMPPYIVKYCWERTA